MSEPTWNPARRGRGIVAGRGRDLGLVLPGFFLSLAAFVVLLPLAVLGVSTAVVWIGVWILPLSLLVAGWFAGVSRSRARAWGAIVPEPAYRPTGTGNRGWVRLMADPRRWLDLAYEVLVAFPLRIATFSVTVTWIGVALGGLTWPLWARFIPGERNAGVEWFLAFLPDAWVSDSFATSLTAEYLWMVAWGLIALVTLPLVARLCATVDAAATRAALGGGPATQPHEWNGGGAR
jgi:hypothetical protein